MPQQIDLFVGAKAVLFDLDGTLVETDNLWAESLAARLASLRRVLRHLDPEALARWLVMAIETPANYAMSTLEHLGLERGVLGLADRLRRSKGLATAGASDPVEGSGQLLSRLHGRFALGVVTTRARREAYAFLDDMGFRRYFGVVITRQDVIRMKPHPEPVRKAARLLGVMPSECVMVGDSVPDIRSARRAGAYAVGVLSGFGTRHELEHAGAQLILDRAALLLDPIDRP